MLAKDIRGVGEQVSGLRTLMCGLRERMDQARDNAEAARLGVAYSLASVRLDALVQFSLRAARRAVQDGRGQSNAMAQLQVLRECAEREGLHLDPDEVIQDALNAQLGLEAGALNMAKEIAELRVVLRKTFEFAQQAHSNQDYICLVATYGEECSRLMRLLSHKVDVDGCLDAYLWDQSLLAIGQVRDQWRAESGEA